MTSPTIISIIVPVYNVEKYISKCIESILAQTFSDFELILIDDGSPDDSGKICDEYAAKDKRIVVIHKENGGVSSARNVGIEYSLNNTKCRWIAFVDSDDWLHPEYLERLVNAAEQTSTKIVACGFKKQNITEIDANSHQSTTERSQATVVDPETFWVQNRLIATVVWAKMVDVDLLKSIRFPEGKIHEDELILFKLIFSQERIAFIPDKLYNYFINPDGIINGKWTEAKMTIIDAFREQKVFFESHNYEKALYASAKDYLRTIGYSMHDRKRAGKSQKKYYKVFKREFYKTFRWYRKKFHKSIKDKEEEELYKMAYPYYMWLYKKIKGNK